MKSGFLNPLRCTLKEGSDRIWILDYPLVYASAMLDRIVEIPAGFKTDFCTVPRVPIAYRLWGNRNHREGVIHDAAYRTDFAVKISRSVADDLFLEAMESRGVAGYIRYPMWAAVRACGLPFFHTKPLMEGF